MIRCTRIKKDGNQCGNPTTQGTPWCRLHGGAKAKGIAAPNFKHGKYSSYLPDRLIPRYEDAIHDAELLSLRDEIGLLDARAGDLLEKITAKQSVDIFGSLTTALEDLEESYMENNPVQLGNDIHLIKQLLKDGVEAEKGWAEIYTVIEGRRRVTETERRRLVEMNQMITTERAMSLLAAILDVIKRNVKDADALVRIAGEIRLLASRSTGGGVGSDSRTRRSEVEYASGGVD